MNGIETLKEIKRSRPALPVLIFTMHAEEDYAIDVMRAGPAAICVKIARRKIFLAPSVPLHRGGSTLVDLFLTNSPQT